MSRLSLARLTAASLLLGVGTHAAQAQTLHVVVTTPDLSQALTPQQDVTVGPNQGGAIAGIDDSKSFQKIDGFGAAMTDTSMYLLSTGLPPKTQSQVLSSLFSKGNGIGLSLMRIPMGSSDFTATPPNNPGTYSYDDNNGNADPNLNGFNIGHDIPYIIPTLRAAQAINPDLKYFANPWSPPAWMKTNNSMLGTTNGNNVGQLNSNAYAPLANYFVKFLQSYRANGVPVWGITPQNEPTNPNDSYANELFPADAEANFIRSYLAPALSAAGLNTQILAGDVSGVDTNYADTLFGNAGGSFQATAWHCYWNNLDQLATVARNHPGLPMYVSECSSGSTGISPLNATQTMLESTHFGASGALLWNLALDPSGGPKMGRGCDGCTGLVTIDPNSQTVSYTINYYQIGHFSRYIDAGATLVQEIGGNNGIWDQAYRNPDGSEVLVLYNTNNSTQTFTVQWNNAGSFKYTLPAYATATFFTRTVNVPTTRTLPVGSKIRFGAVTWPGFAIRHQNFKGYISNITPSSSALDQNDSTFTVRQGRGRSSCYSFESVNYPGYFLQHQNFKLVLNPGDTSTVSLNGTTWCAQPPLNGSTDPAAFSLQSIDWPGYFLRHQNFEVNMMQDDGAPMSVGDATFNYKVLN